jgi:acyl-coenzyme A thioesterase PaaI-like protein
MSATAPSLAPVTAPSPHATPARFAAAGALRRLGHAVVGHQVDDPLLDEVTRTIEEVTARIESGPPRSRPSDDMKRRLFDSPPADGEGMDHFPDCVVSGKANPMGVAIEVHRAGDVAVARVALGAAFEGAPGRAHGGIVAAVFDDTMGFVLSMHRTAAFTGRLTVSYRAPTPVGETIEFRAWLREVDGRKLWIDGSAHHGDLLVAEAEGLFISIPPERFALAPDAERA